MIAGASSVATVVQNSLDGQQMRAVTTINATAASLAAYRNWNIGASLRGALIDALRR